MFEDDGQWFQTIFNKSEEATAPPSACELKSNVNIMTNVTL